MNIQGILIPEDATEPTRAVEVDAYGGNISAVLQVSSFEMTVLPGGALSLYLDAEAAYKPEVALNRRASTFFYQESLRLSGMPSKTDDIPRAAMIFGPVLVLGGPDKDGVDTSVPQDYIDLLLQ